MAIDTIEISESILTQLRKIVRAMDIQSRQLQRTCALTSPQLVILREIVKQDEISIGALAGQVSLSNATVTGIIDRLEQRDLVVRKRGKDRRQVLLASTESGRTLCEEAPPLMQERFLASLAHLQPWEQAQMLAVLSRLSCMMSGTPDAPCAQEPEGDDSARETAPREGFIETCRMLLEQGSTFEQHERDAAIQADPLLRDVNSDADLPEGLTRALLARFLNEHLRPYEDAYEDILNGLEYALSPEPGKGGFIVLAYVEGRLAGALVLLHTGMGGYVPEHLLLFIAVDIAMRGRGIGARLIRHAQQRCPGDIKLHVDYDNPARRLYERMGFANKYAEMRWKHEPGQR